MPPSKGNIRKNGNKKGGPPRPPMNGTGGHGQIEADDDVIVRPPLAPGVKYRRILLKLSGEALMGQQGYGIEAATLSAIADELIDVHSLGVEVGIVIG